MAQAIDSLDSLREHLQWALELEHCTLPPYLCALYSLEPERNPEAREVLLSVFIEEMLHLTLVANLLNAVGGEPRLATPEMLKPFPRSLPHGALEVSLLPFGREALALFLRIEQPAAPNALPEADHYQTIGQFYEALELGLRTLCAQLGEAAVFRGDPARQVTSDAFYEGGGRIIEVRDLDSALAALSEIVEQGEGAAHREVWDGDRDVYHPEREQVAHYFRFQELALGRRYQRGDTPASGPTGEPLTVDWSAVRPMQRNPVPASPGSVVREAQDAFDRTYCQILEALERTFNGKPKQLASAIGAMYRLKAQAQTLMALPSGDHTAGPTFTYLVTKQSARSSLG